jgi:hypothetical protein
MDNDHPLDTDVIKHLGTRTKQLITPTPRYSASGIGFCDRKLYYKVLGTPGVENLPMDAECRMAVGNTVHEVIQNRIKTRWPEAVIEGDMKPLEILPGEVERRLGEEANFDGVLHCSGRPDVLIPFDDETDPTNDMDIVVEIKTGGSGILKMPISQSYRIQGGVYYRGLGVKWVFFLLCDRVGFGRKMVRLEDPDESWNDALRIINLIEYHKNVLKKPPDVPRHLGKRICSSCSYYKLCFK